MQTTKIDKNTIAISKVIPQEIVPAKTEVTEYKYSFLLEQKKAVEQDLANVITRHATELAVAQANVDEVVGLLKECGKLGVDGVEPAKLPVEVVVK